MKKKILLIIMVVVMCFTLVGCKTEKKDDNRSKKEGTIVTGVGINYEDNHGVIFIGLADAKTKSIVKLTENNEPLDANQYGFSSDSAKLLTFIVKNGDLFINYEATELGYLDISDIKYKPNADFPLIDDSGNTLTEFSVDEIPYVNKDFK